jgi:hypothetical protein
MASLSAEDVRRTLPMGLHRPTVSIGTMSAVAVGVLALVAAAAPEAPPAQEKPRIVLGRIEYVVVRDAGLRLKARIDTGAGVSSIHAKILDITTTADGERVRFELADAQGKTKTLERPIVGWSNIKVMGSDEKHRRPIVQLRLCVGGKKLKGRVNLNDRSNYLYPVLIGRNLLNAGKFLVDPGEKYLVEPKCD